MLLLFRQSRSALLPLCKQFRELHISACAFNVPSFNINEERKAFLNVLPEVIDCIVTSPKLSKVPEVSSWIKQLLDYTTLGGKLTRGKMVSIGYRMFEDPTYYSEDIQHSARVLGWVIELLQTYIILMDDMMDGATMRRGKPCWHTLPNIGLNAINDCILIHQSALEVLEIYFGKTPFYVDLIKLLNEVIFKTIMGQHLDLTSCYNNKLKKNLDVFTLERYNNIMIHKCSYISVRLPTLASQLLLKNGKEKATKEIYYNICMELGKLIQIQDDYLDAYGDKTMTGTDGTDIQEGKCTWLAVNALKRFNDTQRSVFEEFFGSKDLEHVKRIKQLYDELNMSEVYQQHQRSFYDDLKNRIHALPSKGESKFFLGLLNYYYKRLF